MLHLRSTPLFRLLPGRGISSVDSNIVDTQRPARSAAWAPFHLQTDMSDRRDGIKRTSSSLCLSLRLPAKNGALREALRGYPRSLRSSGPIHLKPVLARPTTLHFSSNVWHTGESSTTIPLRVRNTARETDNVGAAWMHFDRLWRLAACIFSLCCRQKADTAQAPDN